jgi:hypothetical protein
MVHASRTVAVETADRTFRVHDGDELLTEVLRTTSKASPGPRSANPYRRGNAVPGEQHA